MADNLTLIDSASILVIRDNERSGALEILMVKRHADIDFAGGAYVFPGGKVDPDDQRLSQNVPSFPVGYSELTHTAFREVFEESGLLVGHGVDVGAYRNALLAGEISFAEFVKNADVTFNVEDLVPFARWVTPRIYPKRFDTRFFLARAPKDQHASPDGQETIDAIWVEPLDFIEKCRGEIMFPTLMNLKLLAEARTVEEAMNQARARKIITVEPRIEDGIRTIDPAAGYGEADQGNSHQGFKSAEE
jgi:8-oxo-dGTP pyrophosphatase MutT (NUDIX family)